MYLNILEMQTKQLYLPKSDLRSEWKWSGSLGGSPSTILYMTAIRD